MLIDLGKIKMVWKGAYDASVLYEKDDIVFYGGSSYIFIGDKPASGLEPGNPRNNKSWDLIVSGLTVRGEQGDLVFYGENGLRALKAGAPGSVLFSAGAGTDPYWEADVLSNRVAILPSQTMTQGGYSSAGVIMKNGSLRMWGNADVGQLGAGEMRGLNRLPSPTSPHWKLQEGIEPVKWLKSFQDNLCLTSDGTVFAWGRNTEGFLGVGHNRVIHAPTRIIFPDNIKITDIFISDVSNVTDSRYCLFLGNNGEVFSSGTYIRDAVSIRSPYLPLFLGEKEWVAMGGTQKSHGYIFGLDKDGHVWMCSSERNERNSERFSMLILPQPCLSFSLCSNSAPDNSDMGRMGHMLLLLEDGRVMSWGNNGCGQLGLGNTDFQPVPEYIESLGNDNAAVFTYGEIYGSSVVLKKDGTLRVFGNNTEGQLGLKRFSSVEPIPENPGIPEHNGIKQILPIGNSEHVGLCILFNDGTIMTSGHNGLGNIGRLDGTAADRFEEVHIMGEKPVAICPVGTGANCGLGILTETGSYYQTGTAHGGQIPGVQDSFVASIPYRVIF